MFDQLKPLMRNGERYIVVEDGRPEYVVLRFSDYALLTGGRQDPASGGAGYMMRSASGHGEWERANTEFGEARTEPVIRAADFGVPVPAMDPTTIRLEDLPL